MCPRNPTRSHSGRARSFAAAVLCWGEGRLRAEQEMPRGLVSSTTERQSLFACAALSAVIINHGAKKCDSKNPERMCVRRECGRLGWEGIKPRPVFLLPLRQECREFLRASGTGSCFRLFPPPALSNRRDAGGRLLTLFPASWAEVTFGGCMCWSLVNSPMAASPPRRAKPAVAPREPRGD